MNEIVISSENDPAYNLAAEEAMARNQGSGARLFLWQNQQTVVIGRNQNPFAECNPQRLAAMGITLVRRLSGGGAVYHDLGNLNYSFLCREVEQKKDVVPHIIIEALKKVHLECEVSGRNDMLVGGRKCSGQANYTCGPVHCHHGTLMVNVDVATMETALTPSKIKLASHGIASIRSRVVNLSDLAPGLSTEHLSELLTNAFCERLGPARQTTINHWTFTPEQIQKYRDHSWTYGQSPHFSVTMDYRAPDGFYTLSLEIIDGIINDLQISTDSLLGINHSRFRQAFIHQIYEEITIQQRFQLFAEDVHRQADAGPPNLLVSL